MKRHIVAIRLSEEASNTPNGVVIYVLYSDGTSFRNEVAPDMVEAYGVPVI